ncbi:MAG: flavodoxin family protein [candidate division Zixibacteria bacterium]|nr:flavodoxin family protein [candidate division Zixibacteria bacterium]
MIRLLAISGSPVTDSSTDYLLKYLMDTISSKLNPSLQVQHEFVKLNELKFVPCQSCGKAPNSGFCIYDDDLTDVYKSVVECDCLLFGSPVYFDSVSAQAKAFIDRCNCFRPPNFEGENYNNSLIKSLNSKRPGAIVLIGGERGWFEGARRVVAGFLKWVEVVNKGLITYTTTDLSTAGNVRSHNKTLDEASELGQQLATDIEQNNV